MKTKEMKSKFKTLLEEMQVQAALGKADGQDAFKKLRKEFTDQLKEAESKLDELEDSGREGVHDLKLKLGKASAEVELLKIEGEQVFEEQKVKADKAVKELREKLQELRHKGEEYAGEIYRDLEPELLTYKMRFDMFRVQLALGRLDAEDRVADFRKELKEKLEEVKSDLDELADDSEDRWERFTEDLGKTTDQFAGALKKLVS
jgi:hypothetical protein